MSIKPLFVFGICFLAALQFFIPAYSQDSTWKNRSIKEDLFISMPGTIYEVDSPKVIINGTHFKGYGFQANYVKKSFDAKNGSELSALYEGFIKGYLNAKTKPYKSTVTDTSFKGTRGKWVHSIYSQDTAYQERFTYIVLANGHFYTIVFFVYKPMGPDDYSMLSRYCSSISFPRPVKEYSAEFTRQTKIDDPSKLAGRLMVFLFVVVGGIVLLLRRLRKQ